MNDTVMSTMSFSLPGTLKAFVDEQVTPCGYSTGSEDVRALIRKGQDRQQLHRLLLAGAESRPEVVVDAGYFETLRARVRQ